MKLSTIAVTILAAAASQVEAGNLRIKKNVEDQHLGYVETSVVLKGVSPESITCTMCPDDDAEASLKTIVSSAYTKAYNQHHPGNKMTNADISFSIEKPEGITCTMCPDDDSSSKASMFVMGIVAPVSMITCTMCPDDDNNLQLIKMDGNTKSMVEASFNKLLKDVGVGSIAAETVKGKKAANTAAKSLVKSSILLSGVQAQDFITCTMCPDDDSASTMQDFIKGSYIAAFNAIHHNAEISDAQIVFVSKPSSSRLVVDVVAPVSMITCTMCPDDDAAFGADFHMDAVQKLFEKNMKMKAVFLN